MPVSHLTAADTTEPPFPSLFLNFNDALLVSSVSPGLGAVLLTMEKISRKSGKELCFTMWNKVLVTRKCQALSEMVQEISA